MKKSLLSGLFLASSALLLVRKARNRSRDRERKPTRWLERMRHPEEPNASEQATRRYIIYVLLPVWSLAGVLDWLWHRQTRIETTSGFAESLTHALMMVEVGVPLLMGLFLEVNAGVLGLMSLSWLTHELTAGWDVDYTSARRKIPPREQRTHVFLETIPFDIVAVLACLHPGQFRSLLGLGSEKPRFALRPKQPPLPARSAAVILGSMALFVGAPHIEELWRCWRARQQGLAGRDTPECARELYAS